ncbi:hypothetical protein G6L45_16225 [Agrobacterium rhizogenes]|nr:hypothetical protein [Rhizobium rhizogenes]NTH97031.1 hypothetical protein [Rhizobium rhizogenes]NTJ15217.1 hypothetical protein [Rhizobium rhizogenes]
MREGEVMADSKHTPGPWKAIAMGGSSTIVSTILPPRNDTRSKVGYGYRDGEYCIGYPFLDDEDRVRMDFVCFSHDDARLIAAAPELLEALKAVIEWDHQFNELDADQSLRPKLLAAIAKAEGRS